MHPYDRHVGRYGKQLAAGLIEFVGVARGDRVLDVGCGTGQLTMQLAAVVGAENVAALDPSEAVVAVCRSRVPAADVRIASAESLPFADGGFDAVLAQLVINLVDDPPGAVREMARVAHPGAPVAACFWDDEEMPLLRSFWDAARAVAPGALAQVNDQAQVGLRDVEQLREWWTAAGLRDVTLGEMDVTAEYENFSDLWFSFEAGVGHSGGLYVSLDPEEQRAMRAHAYRHLDSPEGAFRLAAKARTVRGMT
jgi:ubiquinone/menaquinone biosynthesis C-methylase UbiE